MLAPGGEIETESEAATLAVRSLAAFPAFVEELERESALAIDFQQRGAVELAITAEDAEELDRRAETQSRLGIHSYPVAQPGVLHARRYPDDALVNPRDVTTALLAACERRGVELVENCSVDEVREDGIVGTPDREYRSETVLLATGAWSSLFAPEAQVRPLRGHLISYGIVDFQLEGILRYRHTYLLQRNTGELIAGATTEDVGFHRELDKEAVDVLQARAETVLPALRGLPVHQAWCGFRPYRETGVPWIGPVRGKVWGAFGHYRNGILMAPETARRIAEMCR